MGQACCKNNQTSNLECKNLKEISHHLSEPQETHMKYSSTEDGQQNKSGTNQNRSESKAASIIDPDVSSDSLSEGISSYSLTAENLKKACTLPRPIEE